MDSQVFTPSVHVYLSCNTEQDNHRQIHTPTVLLNRIPSPASELEFECHVPTFGMYTGGGILNS